MNTTGNIVSYHNLSETIFDEIAQDIISTHISDSSLLIGLGSGKAVSKIVNKFTPSIAKNCEFICTSLQIKTEAEKRNLKILDETKIPFIDLVIDGADQIDKNFIMIKGGGGALLREKIVYYSSKKTIIIGDESKFVDTFSRSLPVEVLPFARTSVVPFIKKLHGLPILRILDKGYPYLTENGNLVFDISFKNYADILVDLDNKLKQIPGILETGLFVNPATFYYKALSNGNFDIINCADTNNNNNNN